MILIAIGCLWVIDIKRSTRVCLLVFHGGLMAETQFNCWGTSMANTIDKAYDNCIRVIVRLPNRKMSVR